MRLLLFYPSQILGILALLAIVLRWLLASRDRVRSERLLVAAIFIVFIGNFSELAAARLSVLRPLKYDLYVYKIDGLLGFQPSFALARLVLPHKWADIVLILAYDLLGFAVLALCCSVIWKRSKNIRFVLIAVGLNIAIAPLLYLLFPVCGPQFAFPNFPVDPGQVIPHGIPINAAANGIPSVHCSTALLILWFSRKRPGAREIAAVYLVLVVVSTLVSGQHYLFDLIAAVPYTAIVLRLSRAGEMWLNRAKAMNHATVRPERTYIAAVD